MKIDILTLFPDMFTGVFGSSILKKAQEKEAVELRVVNFAIIQRVSIIVWMIIRMVAALMVLTPQPIFDAVEDLTKETERKPRSCLNVSAR